MSRSHKRVSTNDAVDDPTLNKKQKTTTTNNNCFSESVNGKIADRPTRAKYQSNTISHHDSSSKKKFGVRKQEKEADETCAGSIEVDPHTPPNHNQLRNETQLQTPLSTLTNATISHFDSPGGSLQMLETGSGVSVKFKVDDGEYVLIIKRRNVPSSSDERNVEEETNELARSAGLLLVQAEMLRGMGEQLLAQYRASLQRTFGNLVPATGTPLTHH
ncbi:uncharacterized protein LOC109810121 [Cajanus cajan]|uniref:uncharacterized protein LOC109810121 n=1 Tax=Cajanus cajan TaxID=3821 RepID=UPI0010FB4CE5|nr:uncharacterized protein LOC109810121 [Cajanus cajan]